MTAFKHGSKAKAYANGYDLSGYLKSVSFSANADTAETSTLGTTAKTYVGGLKDATLSAEGLFDGAAGAVDVILNTALGTEFSLWTVLPHGDVLANPAYGFQAIHTSYEVSSPVDDVVSVTTEAQSKVAAERGTVYHVLSAEVDAASGTGVDYGSVSSTAGAVGYLQVTAYTSGGFNGAGIRFQDSADNLAWVDITGMTFATVTAANVSERVATSTTATIRRYTRWDLFKPGTGFTSITFSLMFRRG